MNLLLNIIFFLCSRETLKIMMLITGLDVGVRDGRIKKGDTLLFEGIGGGFSWGSILTEF